LAGTGLRLGLLGPLEARVDGVPVAVPAGRPTVVLAVLALAGGRPVSTDTLADRVWGDQPPEHVRASLASLVLRLRQVLGPEAIRTVPPGYALAVPPEQIDMLLFRRLVREAGTADPAAARALLDRALGLWRGEALDGIRTDSLRGERAGLAEELVGAQQAKIGLDLAAGRYAEAVGPLRELTARHPLREPLWHQLITALAGAGRGAEALAAYEDVRVRLRDELGADPSPSLQALYQEILAGGVRAADRAAARTTPAELPTEAELPTRAGVSARVSSPAGRRPPALLPPVAAGFTGRGRELAQLDALQGGPVPAAVVAITGTAGVGKTTLALQWAHRSAGRFPDGSLYVDLAGFAPGPPLRPVDALARLLRGLGLPGEEVPTDLADATGLYRTLLAGTRTLIVLDNAAHPDQVRPLLPGSPTCLALVTSRDRLSGLVARDGAQRLPLDVLTPAEAAALLDRLLGAEAVRAGPRAVAELGRRCGYLPLALRIAAANFTEHPHQTLAGYTAELAKGQLAALAVAGDEQAAVRAAFDRSYAVLPAAARQLFRFIGLVPGADLDAAAAAALLGGTGPAAEPLLARLAAAHLIEHRAPGRFGCHDLLRLYAGEQAEREEAASDREAALQRLLDHYIARVAAAGDLLYPTTLRLPVPAAGSADEPAVGHRDAAAALAWLETERPNLVAAVRHAAEHGPRSAAWLLADGLRMYFYLRMHLVDWEATATEGLTAAETDDDDRPQVAAHLSLALLRFRQGRAAAAIDHYTEALRLAQGAGWPEGEATALNNLGLVYANTGRPRLAADSYRQALAIQRRLGRDGGTAAALGNLASLHFELGQLSLAAAHDEQALVLYRAAGNRVGEAVVLAEHGQTCRALGRLTEAERHLEHSLALSRELGNRTCEAEALHRLAAVRHDAGRLGDARRLAGEALDEARAVEHRGVQSSALGVLAAVHTRRGDPAGAADRYQQALALARDVNSQYLAVDALTGLALARAHLGDGVRAAADAEQARRLACRSEYRALEGQALAALAAIRLRQGDAVSARRYAEQSAQTFRAVGHPLGEARALVVISRALHRAGHHGPARQRWGRALTIFASCGAAVTGPDHLPALPG
jgi:DNA-binding SARP family transcriptional activator/Tfp pilus assembly protein PilF